MNSSFYLNRTLFSDDQQYSEADLLSASKHIIILAEPGAGKTELLKSLADQLKTTAITANVFSYIGSTKSAAPLVIDAFDELAKIDERGIHKLLANISMANPTHVIISSRSSEWDNSATSNFEQFLGQPPLIARLCDFDDSEQKYIFAHHTKRDDFVAFKAEVTKFSLEPLLPNPQFLKLFADAYIESDGHFFDKKSIFVQAIRSLAREVNVGAKSSCILSNERKIELSSEIFAKLLLSSSEGIGTSELSEDRMYPLIGSLSKCKSIDVSGILATRLFKPGDNVDQHRPVHKIVSEYCAAGYLVERITKPEDSLTIIELLPIIAPNGTVRDELRGLLGWMASLGNKPIEEAIINLDPYAVLANGDPSQLEPSSKRMLLSNLKKFEETDPYFRRSDFWRRFSITGFFSQEVVKDVKTILTNRSDGHLRNLLLELLIGVQATEWFDVELRQLMLSKEEEFEARRLARNSLLRLDDYDIRQDLTVLINEETSSSLDLASDIITTLYPLTFNLTELEEFFRKCAKLYPERGDDFESSSSSSRYFIRNVISYMNQLTIESLLDSLSGELACICGKKEYECDCRSGISKIIGMMFDRYVVLAKPPFNPLRIWSWIQNLNFTNMNNIQSIPSVKFLRDQIDLRQGIISHVFGGLTDRDQIFKLKVHSFGGHYSHSGLRLTLDDYLFIVDLAFKTDNLELWTSFIGRHDRYKNKESLGPDHIRRIMRKQASKKLVFMKEWAFLNRQFEVQDKEMDRKWDVKNRRSMRRQDAKEMKVREDNIKFLCENSDLIESGRHWGCLVDFARLVLDKPENIKKEFGDEILVKKSLYNCLDFIEELVPSVEELAELQCKSQGKEVEYILYAACVEIIRANNNLEGVKRSLLIALRTNLNISYSGVNEKETEFLKAEVDRLIFDNVESAEEFLRNYLEPQLSDNKCLHPEIGLLKYDEIFSSLRPKLSIEWLGRFDRLESYALDTLFEIAAQYGDRKDLNEIIKYRCSKLLQEILIASNDKALEQKCKFWFIRAFYFLTLSEAMPFWEHLKLDRDTVFLLNGRSGQLWRNENLNWSKLTPSKIEAILDAFFNKWPKVHLPNSYGSSSPKGETAYRFLTNIIWTMSDESADDAVYYLDRLILNSKFIDIHKELKTIKSEQLRKKSLCYFKPPTSLEVVELLDNNSVVTVEGLRQQVIQELTNYQMDINGGEFNVADRFYTKDTKGNDVRLDELKSVEIISERLNLILQPKNITITSEHQTKEQNRIDITASKAIAGKRRLLVIEAKGQWHKELYTAAVAQLYDRYSIHPDAEQQGIYLVIWFGENEKVANKKTHKIKSARELRQSIEDRLPLELKGFIDVFVLDVSKS